jgi:tetratricopeptide (TPR) repeat protein
MKKLASFALIALMSSTAVMAQFAPVPSETMGSHMRSPEEKALDCYGRGVKLMKKAKGETDHGKQVKLYTKAKDEFSKSVGYTGHYDGYLALGQAFLALGQLQSALDACTQARSMKPSAEEAQACILDAQKAPASGEAKPAGGR